MANFVRRKAKQSLLLELLPYSISLMASGVLLVAVSCGDKAEEKLQVEEGKSSPPRSGSGKIEQTEYVTSEVGDKIVVATAKPFARITFGSSTPVPLPPEPVPWEPKAALDAIDRNCKYCHNDFVYKEIVIENKTAMINSIENPSARYPMPMTGWKPNDHRTFKGTKDYKVLLDFLKNPQ